MIKVFKGTKFAAVNAVILLGVAFAMFSSVGCWPLMTYQPKAPEAILKKDN